MKQRNNLIILSFILVAVLGISLFAQSYSVPSPISAYDVAVWANRGGFVASGTAIPSAVASEGALYVDNTIATQPTLYRYGSGAWHLVAGGSGGVSTHSLLTGLDFASSGHAGFASSAAIPNNASFTLTGLSEKNFSSLANKPSTLSGFGITDGALNASLTAHIATYGLHVADQSDPHGATMTVSQGLTIGDPTATDSAYIDSPATGVVRIASYIQLVFEDETPAISSEGVTLWADNASKCVYLHNGSNWSNLCGTYGGIHAHDNATSQSIPNGTAYATITALIDSHASNDVLVSTSTQSITINRAGVYRISFNASFYTDTNNIIGYFAAFQNKTELDHVHFERKIGTGADVDSSAASGFVRLNAGDIITLRARHSHTSAVAVTITYGNLNVERVGT